MAFLWLSYGCHMLSYALLWFSYCFPMVFLWFSYGFPTEGGKIDPTVGFSKDSKGSKDSSKDSKDASKDNSKDSFGNFPIRPPRTPPITKVFRRLF